MPDTGRHGPLILAFDTSAAHCAAALLSNEDIVVSRHEDMAKGQAERLMGLCAEVLDAAGVTYADLNAIGVGIGPGNFTGIRIGVSAARGLALGLGVPAVGVSGFDALRLGTTGPCACAVDARRGQVYVQAFENTSLPADPQQLDADALPPFDGPLIGAGGQPPRHPVAEAIARITAARYATASDRPAPLYLRPADAAPARDAPPTILP
ncbi:tRNA (adenosine(37)-N6)-threonylcarbamoyltransferase complex dimerization subunit type 1 TsaB [Sulfitobacter alexandrii]|uniref:tRNA (Adenosine(37)-N6)-threonylcarbamoyltransferase complex dimerization subunit type 1 TsaB n=1 Tax=Sulfitobacter alexandrii TaxID=1917485 RepID=A0A1J0WJ08_9RHOB|nr:tRNA (adenosine(37)-N6)-threonylcarbamoyltransferase complex dimerization subunit type 1 TsaB [Sulfitobacter alexandrii]APE44305.1 tRNA (adenosine(37)-N6)-threonylcarbamoyltransferase complex dimerization subunit type 1 TsaB [Sulfitobacter alexandrii]